MLSEEKVIDSIQVLEDNCVQVREATRILKDGKEVSKTYHRWCLNPGDDISNQEEKVKSVCNAAWGIE